jgi:hypothetical protein
MTGALVTIAVVAVLWGGFALLLARGRKEYQQIEGELAKVRALPPPKAKELALALLRGGHGWQVRVAEGPADSSLPPAVADILGEYEEVVRGEFWVGRSALRDAARISGFFKIGEDFEFCELMVNATGPEVFSSYGDVEPREPPEVSPTVWHKILEVADSKV